MKRCSTNRGFALVDFEDRNGKRCSLQKSSIADEHCIWLGLDKPDVDEVGWHPVYPLRSRPYDLPEGVTAWGANAPYTRSSARVAAVDASLRRARGVAVTDHNCPTCQRYVDDCDCLKRRMQCGARRYPMGLDNFGALAPAPAPKSKAHTRGAGVSPSQDNRG